MKRALLVLFVLLSTEAAADCGDLVLTRQLDHGMLWLDFSTLAADVMQGRKTGTPGGKRARDYLTLRYRQIGLGSFASAPGYIQRFSGAPFGRDFQASNVVGWLKGSTFPDEYIVISAHYDHLGKSGDKIYNGADDNASGVAVMLALANYLQSNGSQHSVIFLATDAEEKGLLGARAFMQSPVVAKDQIVMNLNLDMLSQNSHRQRLYVFGAKQFPQFKPVVDELKQRSGVCVKAGRHRSLRTMSAGRRINWRSASDHGVFGKHGIPYLFVGVSEHRYYHTAEDTVDKVDREFFLTVAETSLTLFTLMDALHPGTRALSAP